MGKLLKWLFRLAAALVVVVVLVVGGLWVYSLVFVRPEPEQPAAGSGDNTRVFQALAAGGIDDALVGITPERALVRYNLPQGMEEAASWAYALAVLSSVAPQSVQAVVQVAHDFEPRTEISVPMVDVLAMLAGRMSAAQFEELVSVRRAPADSVK